MEAPRCLSERTSGIVAGCKCVRVPHLITHELQIHFCLLSSQVPRESGDRAWEIGDPQKKTAFRGSYGRYSFFSQCFHCVPVASGKVKLGDASPHIVTQ